MASIEKTSTMIIMRTSSNGTALHPHLQAALAGRESAVPMERIHVDTQPKLAAQYRNRHAFMALPAVYLLDGSDNVVELLQGELTQARLSAALEKP